MIGTPYDDLQRQRNRGGGRRDAGHLFVDDAGVPERSMGILILRKALEVVEVGGKIDVGANIGKGMEDKNGKEEEDG